jgi:iron complex transport system ATP-binding protein
MILAARGIHLAYGRRQVLHGADLEARSGQVTALAGPNGSGKSSLLRCALGLLRPERGRVELDGRDLSGLAPAERARLLAYVPQAVPPGFPMSVFEFVLAGRRPHLAWRATAADEEAVALALERAGLEDLALRPYDHLSGGQKQKALLARALAQSTPVLVLDEPTSSLDLRHQTEVMDLLRFLAVEAGIAVLLAAHDLNLAARFAARVILLEQGRVRAAGPPQSTLTPENVALVFGVRCALVPVEGSLHLVHLHQTITEVSHETLDRRMEPGPGPGRGSGHGRGAGRSHRP